MIVSNLEEINQMVEINKRKLAFDELVLNKLNDTVHGVC